MTDFLLPPDIAPSEQEWAPVGNVGVFQSPLSGATRTVSRSGARLGCRIRYPLMKDTDRARLLSIINGLRDRSNRIWVPDSTVTRQGSISADEILTNNTFSNGTTGWTAASSGVSPTLSAHNRVLRVKAAASSEYPQANQSASCVQYAPYVTRAMLSPGAALGGGSGYSVGWYDGITALADYKSSGGLSTASGVALSSTLSVAAYLSAAGYITAGTFFDVPWISASRCGLADGGGNLFLYSDQIDNAAYTKTRCSVSANADTAPDGTSTADRLIEDSSASTTHLATRASAATVGSAAADYSFGIEAKAGARSWVAIAMHEGTHEAYVYLNLSTGAIGTTGTSGANWTNLRAFAVDMGSGWFELHLVARKASSSTGITPKVYIATADNTASYSGDGSSYIRVRRHSFAQSSVPVRLTQTTSAAVSASAQTGSAIYLKGLPASTSGVLRAFDPVQVGNQLVFLTADLDSDAAGRGVMRVSPPVRDALADNAPIIVNTPMALMRLDGDISWVTGPGRFSSVELPLIEDVAG